MRRKRGDWQTPLDDEIRDLLWDSQKDEWYCPLNHSIFDL